MQTFQVTALVGKARTTERAVNCTIIDSDTPSTTVDGDDSKEAISSDAAGEPRLIFTHGASGTIESPACLNFCKAFARYSQARVWAFDGPSNLVARTTYFETLLALLPADSRAGTLLLGGRSLGSRAAVSCANLDRGIRHLICVSYPLVSPSTTAAAASSTTPATEKKLPREEILLTLGPDVKVLFITGSKDDMCPLQDLNRVRSQMRAKTWLCLVRDADHGMAVKAKDSGGTALTTAGHAMQARIAAQWAKHSLLPPPSHRQTDGGAADRERGREMLLYIDESAREWRTTGWQEVQSQSPPTTTLGEPLPNPAKRHTKSEDEESIKNDLPIDTSGTPRRSSRRLREMAPMDDSDGEKTKGSSSGKKERKKKKKKS